jgi:hypothetical protein
MCASHMSIWAPFLMQQKRYQDAIGGGLELGDRFRSSSAAVQGFAGQPVGRGGIWVALLNVAELLPSTSVLLGLEAALGQHSTEPDIAWVSCATGAQYVEACANRPAP